MHKSEKYIPSEAEIKKAEEMMTPEQAEATRIREQNVYQEREPFADEVLVGTYKEGRLPSPEEVESMNNNLVRLGELFKDSELNWHLDGAINISLLKGEYIRAHKDIDISVEEDELQKLDELLGSKGYGLFLSYPKNPENDSSEMIMERVGANDFKDTGFKHTMIAAIDQEGKIIDTEELNYIDVHVTSRDEKGCPLGRSQARLPKEWYEGRRVDFKDQEIKVSHPAKVAYFKIQLKRKYDAKYDETDLKSLVETGALSEKDIDNLSQVLNQEYETRKTRATQVVEKIIDKITPQMSADEIYGLFIKAPEVRDNIQGMEKQIREISEKISMGENKSTEQMVQYAFEVFKTEEMHQVYQERIEQLKNWLREAEDIKNVRNKIQEG